MSQWRSNAGCCKFEEPAGESIRTGRSGFELVKQTEHSINTDNVTIIVRNR